ncbi:MAG: beta-ketoacyl-[acyl-carrier-protein] synthase family protein [Pirellulaceae bacterium]
MAQPRVVITGIGQISPLGNTIEDVQAAFANGTSGVRELVNLPTTHLPMKFGAEAVDFTGDVSNFGELEKMTMRSIKKGQRLMSREIQMGVAAAQHALASAELSAEVFDPDQIGVVFGSDYIMTVPTEFREGVLTSRNDDGSFDLEQWGEKGLPNVNPLWLLKYLPNMPASHIAIYNDLRGPSNSLTMREASANLAIAEAFCTIARGDSDVMVTGSTGTRVHPMRTLHVITMETVADNQWQPAEASRPFQQDSTGMVIGEGAGSLIIERLEFAQQRNATIFGEIIGFASSTVLGRDGTPGTQQALENVMNQALAMGGISAADLGHIHAHGIGMPVMDTAEAHAIRNVIGDADIPVVAAKSYFGNLGAGSGTVETICSLLSMQSGTLFPTLNAGNTHENCPINVVSTADVPAGECFINVNVTPQGQASSLLVKKYTP